MGQSKETADIELCRRRLVFSNCDDKKSYNHEIQSMIDFHDEGKICTVISEDGRATVYRQDRNKFFIE